MEIKLFLPEVNKYIADGLARDMNAENIEVFITPIVAGGGFGRATLEGFKVTITEPSDKTGEFLANYNKTTPEVQKEIRDLLEGTNNDET